MAWHAGVLRTMLRRCAATVYTLLPPTPRACASQALPLKGEGGNSSDVLDDVRLTSGAEALAGNLDPLIVGSQGSHAVLSSARCRRPPRKGPALGVNGMPQTCDGSRGLWLVSRAMRHGENVSLHGVLFHPLRQEIEVAVPDEGATFEVVAHRKAVEGTGGPASYGKICDLVVTH